MTLQERLILRYGNPFRNQIAFENNWMTIVPMPPWLQGKFPDSSYGPVKRFYINKDIVKPFLSVMQELVDSGLYIEMKRFDGLFNVRKQRSSNSISLHSFGLAIDFNAINNPLGLTKAQAIRKGLTPFSDEFDECWRKHGWTCGIDWKRPDGMHYEHVKHLN